MAQHILLQLQTLQLTHFRRFKDLLHCHTLLLLQVYVFSWQLSASFSWNWLVDLLDEIGVYLRFLFSLFYFFRSLWFFDDWLGLYLDHFLYFWGFDWHILYGLCFDFCDLLFFEICNFLRRLVYWLLMDYGLMMMFFTVKEIPVKISIFVLDLFKLRLLKICEFIFLFLLFALLALFTLLNQFSPTIVRLLCPLWLVAHQKCLDNLFEFIKRNLIQFYL